MFVRKPGYGGRRASCSALTLSLNNRDMSRYGGEAFDLACGGQKLVPAAGIEPATKGL